MPCFKANNKCLVREHQGNLEKIPQKVRPRTAESQEKPANKIPVSCAHKTRQLRNERPEALKMSGVVAPINTCTGARPRPKVPKKVDKIDKKTVLQTDDLQRMKSSAKLDTVEDRVAELNQHEEERKRKEREVQHTRRYFKNIDDTRKKAIEAKTEKEDLFGDAERAKTLERAFLEKHEQEEEIKLLNRYILNVKCNAVRDGQIQEKSDISRRLRDDERCLEKIVTDRAAEAIRQDDANEQMRKEKQMRYAQEITAQLVARQNMRFLEAERIEEEAVIIRQKNEAVKLEERRQQLILHERKMKFREELKQLGEMAEMFKKMLCEQERDADFRVAEYMRAKQQKERELAAEKQLAKDAAESRRQRIFTLAQKRLESKTHSEELAYIREQERIEREYRRKEKEAILRKRQIEKELLDARESQLEETRRRHALQITREEEIFKVFMDQLKKAEKQEKEKNEIRAQQNKCHREGIMCQMNQKEMARRRLLDMERADAISRRELEEQREKTLKAVIDAKIQSLQEVSLPTKYIKDIEMQLKKIKSLNKLPPMNCNKK